MNLCRRAAQPRHRFGGRRGLGFPFRPLHGDEAASLLDEGEAIFRQHGQGGHRPGGGNVELFPQRRLPSPFLRPGVDQGDRELQGGAQLPEKNQPLVQAVQQGQLEIPPDHRQRDPRKSGASSHVDETAGAGGKVGERR